MTETVSYINNSLKDLYPPGEIRSFIRLIIEHVCGLQPYQYLAGKGNELSGTKKEEIRQIVERLKQSEPIQYVLGITDFYGLTFNVNPSVLIPRPETEELVDRIVNEQRGKALRILDIGTGSGCIAIALSRNLPESEVLALDVSEAALLTARENNLLNKATVSFIQADVLSPEQLMTVLPASFDVLVSNPPYVLDAEKALMEANVLMHEPAQALFVPDDDPLLFYRAIVRLGKEKLSRGGFMYLEINAQCGGDTVALLQEEGYVDVELIRDLQGKDRMIKARR
ncbi:release factor glutamine methyltransferase [Parabacteroides sp. PF5-5]|uniref:peptide chain release factor N(5)-glutamine methyltransferase n=1 Tax=unclassified Parabacteroides TaxID=2649774 RepID=UPI00247337E9|nr:MULTISPECIES: peptide chain release factor N(5)-glutamine methyltransferase [unclassified Parabacteroides]MDH6306084.1 release factor glutamine methyltransferase [Parabacteroides sp. PH5-39]MDH6317018.1 release factor glutamine methyltransferase [Parabacteroides sp. PF5-13]MDH6320771.1 release factor glutamine methyltransferase [Parabacteroides sp. PH5-13]MDH6324527.1 release factor glutamine methyltransferase [Parabacteroides sp. PH5-8]MDH6328203.1 release factor glutamine methyltransferas